MAIRSLIRRNTPGRRVIGLLLARGGVPRSVLAVVLLLLPPASRAEARAVLIDGRFGDWADASPACVDPPGDGGEGGLDIGRVGLANSDDALFMRFDLGREISLQTGNRLVLYLDTDDDPLTGLPVGTIGADLSWRFGERKGFLHLPGREVPVNAYDLGLVTAPTVTSSRFELSIRRGARPGGLPRLFSSPAIRWALRDEGASHGDTAPDPGASVPYVFDETPLPPYPAIDIGRERDDQLRVLSYNVREDGIFLRSSVFGRILNALAPDVVCLQEIRRHGKEEAPALLSRLAGGNWHVAQHGDCFTLSRHPIAWSRGLRGAVAARIDLPDDRYRRDLLILNAHLGSGGQNRRRQAEADGLMAFVRDAKTRKGEGSIRPGTPILLVGDLNLVGFARQLDTLLSGDIEDEATFGPDHPPDWDEGPMADLLPPHNAAPESYTWSHSRRVGYSPGRLDYVLYTGSVIEAAKGFVLRTESMTEADLAANGLRRGDCSAASDHLPVVVDLVLPPRPAQTAGRNL